MGLARVAPPLALAGLLAAAPAAAAPDAGVTLHFVRAAGGVIAPASEHVPVARRRPGAPDAGEDEVRIVAVGAADALPSTLVVSSLSPPDADGARRGLDARPGLALTVTACPPGIGPPAGGATCAATRPLRVVMDDLDRAHRAFAGGALLGEVGGALVASAGPVEARVSVGGPSASEVGAIPRLRARLRVHVLRVGAGGPPAIGRDPLQAQAALRGEIARASALWGACGISFGPPEELVVDVVDPPPPHLLALGCDAGVPASGGTIRLVAEGREVAVPIPRGTPPRGAARLVASALEAAGLVAIVSDNAAISAATWPTSDVLVRRRDGRLATLAAPRLGPLSDDASLTACIGRVAMQDGLTHFTDADSIAGTVEERTLIKALDDGDPSTIEVFVVPSFGGDSRIGESFIFADQSAIKNVVLEDRAGFRAHRASFTLAHELGHVLLDQPGHPDDWGLDTPSRLMDADALDGTAMGPRRLELAECERAVRQSGPASPAPALAPWPLVAP